MEFSHTPVLLEECIQGLSIRPDGVYVDGTAGGAGHSGVIAARLSPMGRLIALDKDPDAVETAAERLAAFPQAQVIQSDFSRLTEVLDELGVDRVDGILLDLGVSSHQLDCAERGFSYLQDAALDMRMAQTGTSARDLVNRCSADELARIFREYGEEKFAWKIAQNIARQREQAPIETTFELMEIIRRSVPAAVRREGNPGKQVFQALRIAVNGELDSLSAALDTAFDRLTTGGRFAVITFHSLEDRMVKQKFAALTKGCICPPDFPICVCGRKPRGKLTPRRPVEPSEQELERNRRSRSARLRVIERLD